jgi:Protein of unknown function (DUF1579)
MFRRVLFGAVACLSAAGLAFGQEFPQPGPEHKELHQFEGAWDCVMDMAGQKTKATATYRKICGGMWMESDFEGDFGGMKFQGHGLDGYDQTRKKYVGIWVDSMSSAPLHMEGDYDETKKQTVMTGESVGPDGKPQKVKGVTEMKDDDHFTFKMYMVQPGGQEELAFTIAYTRRK